jgi:hypothetical protein
MMRNVIMGLAVSTASTPALAQHGPGMGFVVTVLVALYVVLCLFSVPVSLLLQGSIMKRVVVGLTAPIIGMALGVGAVEISVPLFLSSNDMGATQLVFVLASVLPIFCVGAWVIIQRSRRK